VTIPKAHAGDVGLWFVGALDETISTTRPLPIAKTIGNGRSRLLGGQRRAWTPDGRSLRPGADEIGGQVRQVLGMAVRRAVVDQPLCLRTSPLLRPPNFLDIGGKQPLERTR